MFRAAILAAVFLCLMHTPCAAAVDPELEALRERLYCPILTYLRAIHAHSPTSRGRFLIVGLRDSRDHYVQCLFYDRDRALLCEVASGFWERPSVRLVPPETLPRLAALGFSTKGDASNYQRKRRVKGPESLAETADTIVRAFREVYGVNASEAFTLEAPLVREPPPTGSYVDGLCEAAIS